MEKTITVCDRCERPPNGDSPDVVYFNRCGHAICNECGRRPKDVPLIKHPQTWCPVCKAVVDGPYAPR